MNNRPLFEQESFTNDSTPHFPCPHCKQGYYKPIQKLIKGTESDHSESPNIEYVGTTILKCNHCKHSIAMIAEVTADVEIEDVTYDGEKTFLYQTFIKPIVFYPPLHIIPCEPPVPLKIRIQLEQSFTLFFYAPDVCANSLRKIIELILTDLKVPQKGALQHRINEFKKTDTLNGSLLETIKWVGNVGSHKNIKDPKINRKDILDAYEILETILDSYYYSKNIKARSEQLTSKFKKQ